LRRRLLLLPTAIAALAGFAVPGLHADLAPAELTIASLFACTTTPCKTDYSQSTNDAGPLSTFGDLYNLTSFIPSLQETGLHTPGKIAAGNPQAKLTASGFGSPHMTASTGTTIDFGSIAAGTLLYFFEVVPQSGSTAPSPVKVGIDAKGSISVTTSGDGQDSSSSVQLIVGTGPGGNIVNDLAQVDYNAGCDPGLVPPCSTKDLSFVAGKGFVSTPGVDGATLAAPGVSYMFGGFQENGTYALSTNTPYEVDMATTVNVAGGSGKASIDPFIVVPSGYNLELSPGVGNSPVPEPGMWVPLAAGAICLLAAKRRSVNRASRCGVRAPGSGHPGA
jgi:hypothetical protein